MEREIPARGQSRDLLPLGIPCWIHHLAQMFVGIYLTDAD